MNFAGKVVLIAGGAGIIGSGIARAFIKRGATVIVPSRNKENLQKLRDYVNGSDKLVTIDGDIGDEKEVLEIKKKVVDQFGSIDHLVTSLGSLLPLGPITQVPLDSVRKGMHDLMISTLVVARTFLPLIADKPGSSYTNMTGAAERILAPPMALVTVGAAALFGLNLALREEFRDRAVRVNEYRLSLRVVRDEDIRNPSFEHSHVLFGEHFLSVVESGVKDSIIRADKTEQFNAPYKI